MRLEFDLDPRSIIRALFLIVAGLAAASLIGQASTYFLGDGHLWGFVPEFNLDREMNIPTWFSSCLFLFAAVLLWKAGGLRRDRERRFAIRWKSLSLIFVLLSIDEAAALHEMAVEPIRKALHASGFLYFSWVVAGAVFCAVLALVYWKLVFSLPAKTRLLFLVAAGLFVGGSLGMEMLGGRFVEHHGSSNFTYALMANAEETLEMLGQVTFIKGLFSLFT
jgi:hypothetical protein